MIIRFVKHPTRPPSSTCIREDGSETWVQDRKNAAFFVEHDMLHYCVETELGFDQAFYGLVAAGRDMNDFGTKDGVKDILPEQAGQAETLVGMLQGLVSQNWNASYSDYEDWLTFMGNPEAPKLTEPQWTSIVTRWKDLLLQLRSLPFEQPLELQFPKQ